MDTCIVCGSTDCEDVARTPPLPVVANHLPLSEREAREVPRASLRLVWCARCDHLFNAEFDPAMVDYALGYENAQHFSPRFRDYLDQTVRRLGERHRLGGKHAVEIGCGDGYFLDLLRRDLGMTCVGYDPAVAPAGSAATEALVAEPPRSDARRSADFVCARHVLEHVPDPVAFLETMFDCLRDPEGVGYVEVPSGSIIVREGRIWELIYEHVSYFTPRSLGHALRRAGLAVRGQGRGFGDQFLWIEAGLGGRSVDCDDAPLTRGEIADFAARLSGAIRTWRATMDRLHAAGRRVVLWGAGSKGVSFLNMVGGTGAMPPIIVDVNPRKAGRFVPGTAQRVVPPHVLKDDRPDTVIVFNPQYTAEIGAALAEFGVAAEMLVV